MLTQTEKFNFTFRASSLNYLRLLSSAELMVNLSLIPKFSSLALPLSCVSVFATGCLPETSVSTGLKKTYTVLCAQTCSWVSSLHVHTPEALE